MERLILAPRPAQSYRITLAVVSLKRRPRFAPTLPDPQLLGCVLTRAQRHAKQADALVKETLSALRALKADAIAFGADDSAAAALREADFVALIVAPGAALPEFPELKDRAAAAVAVAEDEREGRVAIHAARKALRAAGAALGPRELVIAPAAFGFLGLESDSVRERLHILLEALLVDADRLRLKREGWEEPDA